MHPLCEDVRLHFSKWFNCSGSSAQVELCPRRIAKNEWPKARKNSRSGCFKARDNGKIKSALLANPHRVPAPLCADQVMIDNRGLIAFQLQHSNGIIGGR